MNDEQMCERCGSAVKYISEYVVRCVECGEYAESYEEVDELVSMEKIRRRASKEEFPDYE